MEAIETARAEAHTEQHDAPVGMNTGSIPVVVSAAATLPEDAEELFDDEPAPSPRESS